MSSWRRRASVPDVVKLVDDMPPALRDFVRARSAEEAEATIAEYPGLLAGEYDARLDTLIEAARPRRAAAANTALRERRDMLYGLRTGNGAEQARRLFRVAVFADEKARTAGDAAAAEAALEMWQWLVDAPGFASVPPDRRALASNRLGIAHSRCRGLGRGTQHTAAALAAFEQAVTEAVTAGVSATDYRCNILVTRLGEAEIAENPPLDDLLALAQQIVAGAGQDPGQRAEALAQLSATHRLRFLKLGTMADLEAAARAADEAVRYPHDDARRRTQHREILEGIRRLRRAVEGEPADGTPGDDIAQRLRSARAASEAADTPAARGKALHELALAAYHQYRRSSRLDLLDEAIVAAEAAVRATPPTAEIYPARANDLGMLFRQRYQDRRQAGDLWKAVAALRAAVARTGKTDTDWSGRTMNLGNALTQLNELTEDMPAALDEAIELLEEVVRRFPPNAPERGAQLSALSRSLRVRYVSRQNREDLERSIELDREALAAIPKSHPDRAMLSGNAANGLSLISTARDARWRQAIGLWREACQLGLEQNAGLALSCALTWLMRALARDAAIDATDAAAFGQQALDRLLAVQDSRREQEVWLRHAARLPSLAAQVYVEAGQPGRAVLAVEHMRTALMAKTLMPMGAVAPLTLGQLQRVAARDGPLVYLVPGDRAVALIVDVNRASALRLPALTEDAVEDAVSRLYQGYYDRDEDQDGWRQAFDEVTRWLWTAAMGPLLEALGANRRVHLLPGDLLAVLPLHAAWEPKAGAAGTGRRYVGDDLLITLQPSAKLLLRPAPRRASAAPGRLLAVAEPRPTSERPLRWAVAEAHAAAAAFGAADVLVHENATPERVLSAIEAVDVVHFACHGRMEVGNPLAGGLVLADDQLLTIGAVLEAHLDTRLVFASACETASVAPGMPNEVVNFAAALLYAGSQSVLASSFTVDDFSAFLLAARFYAEWRSGTVGPEALRAAVCFLRDTTNAEKLAWVDELRRAECPPAVTQALAGVLGLALPAERSFADPTEWAPFTWWGRYVAA